MHVVNRMHLVVVNSESYITNIMDIIRIATQKEELTVWRPMFFVYNGHSYLFKMKLRNISSKII